MPFDGQTVKQLKQLTHLSKSIILFSLSIQPDLHTVSHIPQPVQSVSSITILYKENLEIKPRNVPTGQIVLQNKRPFVKDIIPIINRMKVEKLMASQLIVLTSIG